jgi:hypothetical protein
MRRFTRHALVGLVAARDTPARRDAPSGAMDEAMGKTMGEMEGAGDAGR